MQKSFMVLWLVVVVCTCNPLEKTINSVKELMMDLRTQVEKLSSKVDGMNSRVGNVESKVDGIISHNVGLDSKVDGIKSRVEQVESKVNGIDSRERQVESKVDGINSRVGQVEVKVRQVESKVSGIDSRLHPLEQKFVGVSHDVESVKNAFTENPFSSCTGEVITVPGTTIKYPLTGNYRSNEKCQWTVDAGNRIKISFSKFDLEGREHGGNEYNDYVEIMQNGQSKGKWKGHSIPSDVVVLNGEFTVHLVSDFNWEYSGFQMELRTIE